VFLRRVDPNIVARERSELAAESVQRSPVTVRIGNDVESGVLYGWARADSERSGKGLVLTTREYAAGLHEEVLRWVPADAVGPGDPGQDQARADGPRGVSERESRS
jgi:hypothetical protein